MVKDHVTGEDVPFVSAWKLLGRRVAAVPGVAIGAFLLSIIVGFVFILQLFLHEYYNGPFAKFLVSFTDNLIRRIVDIMFVAYSITPLR